MAQLATARSCSPPHSSPPATAEPCKRPGGRQLPACNPNPLPKRRTLLQQQPPPKHHEEEEEEEEGKQLLTCHHDSADAGLMQVFEHGRSFSLEFILHYNQAQETHIGLNSLSAMGGGTEGGTEKE